MVLALDDQPEIPRGHPRVLLQYLSDRSDHAGSDGTRPARPDRAARPPAPDSIPTGPTTMPATEETYRRQPTLHLVFAISSIAMLLSTVWMVMADHLRPWKQVQREFQRSSARSSRRRREEKLEEQKAEVPGPDRRDRRQDRGGRGERRGSGPPRSAQVDRELDKLGGEVRAARHAAAVQEGRARQQAQPLRRHDRPRRGSTRRGPT